MSQDTVTENMVYRGSILNPIDEFKAEFTHNGCAAVTGGRIAWIGESSDLPVEFSTWKILDFGDRIICPGFVDSHLHIPQVDQRARFGHSVLDWLQRHIYRAEDDFAVQATARAMSSRFFDEMTRNGTTTCLAFSSVSETGTDAAFEVAAEKGVRAIIGKVMMDTSPDGGPPPESTVQSLRESENLRMKWDGKFEGRLKYAYTPRFAPTCSRDLMSEVGRLSTAHSCIIQSHLAENEEEVNLVMRLFPECRSYTEVYSRYGCLNPRTVMAHCIHMSERELEIFGDSKASIAHCPSSNFYLKSGSLRLKSVTYHGINMGLGSDVGAGPSFSIFDVMKSMNYMQPFPVLPSRCLFAATLGGARALGMQEEVGSLEIGKFADFIVIDIKKAYPAFRLGSLDDLVAFLIFLGDSEVVSEVYVGGRRIHSSNANPR